MAPARPGRDAPLDLTPDAFRSLGHRLVDDIADFLAALPSKPVTPGESPEAVRAALGGAGLPVQGSDPAALLDEATRLLFAHSTFNGHPRFWGYITSSAAPLGALGDLLAASVNANCGAWALSPMATEIEAQTVRWIAELIGYPTDCGGLLVSGGNMANLVCFAAARTARLDADVRAHGIAASGALCIYASVETHTWVQKAADLFGLGTDSIRWIETDAELRMSTPALRARIQADRAAGERPVMVIGTGGSVSTGAVDPLGEIATVCREHGLWFHVDGAYGALAAVLPEASADLKALALADSVAVDPHKWLYAPIEAGCVLVRDWRALHRAFSYLPSYYNFDVGGAERPPNYFEYGPQNTRGFRALKVWLGLRQAGRAGYERMIREDCALARVLFDRAQAHPLLEAVSHGLSITTLRFVPADLTPGSESVETYLNDLNRAILNRIQAGGEAYPSNALVRGRFTLRVCIVNFRTTVEDIESFPALVARVGAEADAELRPPALAAKG